MNIRTKRIYEAPAVSDGRRILVDRIWPRGISKERAQIEAWVEEVAPSAELRKWFGHDPGRWDGFRRRYFRELDGQASELQRLFGRTSGTTTLVYAARDPEHNNAVALKEYIETRYKRNSE